LAWTTDAALVCPVLVGPDDLLAISDRRIAEVAAGAAGATNVEIAEELGITRKTVASHVDHMLAKLGMGRRAEIVVWASTRTSSRNEPTPVLHSPPSRR
jgi:DNA-binding CsgD family transcriptional regulator